MIAPWGTDSEVVRREAPAHPTARRHRMAAVWDGIDAGKTHHRCVAIDESGRRLPSRRVADDEPELLELLTGVMALGDEVT
ncbi:transposase [Streptomyces goshikiensis]|uniref:IS110 family transposase n=1 Tax=Streptomyces goshikiensis TaxID=1942 RepID=UPI0036BD184C